ncbi:TetR/AcrR family transcriptional regulator [Sphingobacterium bambusae]|uniref:TetR/AcrR family transcriptional regulator n=1 Tax=Sphingobacterium bambusae TaxID=662858 RepID=A0ABW6B9K1_9SPHI|nr:TetR/AcrR family transcriptional regulator [Sphingobacterium bambusae]WPL48883.1 TetR/AcrR family transcriptional regulator [Sphingobacterium bambusae]
MKGRPNIHQQEEIIIKAQEVFWQKGFYATSLSDLSHATGAGAGSLYNNFKGGKKELFKKALQQRRADFKSFEQKIHDSEDPISLIKDFFLNLANTDSVAHQKGCLIANTIVEMSFMESELQEEAIKILQETEALYRSVLSKAQQNGELKTTISADVLAKYLITCWCGINSLRRLYPDKGTLREQINLQLNILI